MEAETMVRSIDNCISVLQDDISQPGSSAIFLKLVSSWKDLKSSLSIPELCEFKKHNENLEMCLQKAQYEQISAENLYNGQKEEIKQLSRELAAIKESKTSPRPPAQENAFIDLTTQEESIISDQPKPIVSRTLGPESENGQEVTSEPSTTIQSSAADSEVLSSAPTVSTGGGADDGLGDDYEKVEFSVLYYHKTTGYYYEPMSQQFLAPYFGNNSGQGQVGGAEVGVSGEAQTTQDYYGVATTSQSSLVEGHSYDPAASASTATTTATGQASIADILAATSDRAVERCGYEYNEGLDMFYDANIGLYYHQESKLYYDADLGCYYQYDFDTKTYAVHSRVQLPDQEEGKKKREKTKEVYISSDEEFKDSPEEGEIRLPHMPRGSPPPEEEWDPCIRALVSESESLPKGTLFIITQDGANIGREPTGINCLIKIPELKVSKLHAVLSYDKHEKSFVVQDLGSVNGTFLNKDQRLSEPRISSTPCPLVHGHTLTMGSTTLTLHIHAGWETCSWCDPSRGAWQGTNSSDARGEIDSLEEEELDLQRRKELNRIKKKYGLRMKDTYGQDEVVLNEEYKDRSQRRRKVVGSDVPASQRPDDNPSSVHKPIVDTNKGRRMLEKMGWKTGEGLGRENEGISEPVKAEMRASAKTGLGTSDVSQSLDTAWDQSSIVAKSQLMRRRYDDAIKKEHVKKKRME